MAVIVTTTEYKGANGMLVKRYEYASRWRTIPVNNIGTELDVIQGSDTIATFAAGHWCSVEDVSE